METMKGLHRTHGCGTISEAEVGKEYVITYQAETSIDDGKTWQAVPDAKYEVHVKIAENY